jgi:hypothetical protein
MVQEGLKRFFKFLRDTDRMEYHTAQDAITLLK